MLIFVSYIMCCSKKPNILAAWIWALLFLNIGSSLNAQIFEDTSRTSQEGPTRRRGLQINASELNMLELPMGSEEYIVGAGDVLLISLWGQINESPR